MLRVGLTGGIGCGKSTVAAMMREQGCHVLEADALAHRAIEPGTAAYDEVVREFGREILAADGAIDRGRLAAIVFSESARLERLNRIVHPRVIEEQERWLAERERSGERGVVAVVEAALLIEAGYHTRLDRVVVVWCRPEQQRERLRARGMAPADLERRIAAQMPLEEKRRLASDEIDTSGTLEETRRQVEALVARLKQLAATPRPAEHRVRIGP